MLVIKRKKISSGFSLVELLVAMVIGALLFSALLSIFVANLAHYQKVLNANRLNQQLETAIDLMSDDIRRAGYWANANNDIGLHQNNNPFMTNTTDITINGSNNCILFSYDHDRNGSIPTIDPSIDDERYGFRLSNGIIQIRPPGGGYDCASSGWENMTDSKIVNVTALSFVLNSSTVVTGPGTRGIRIRSVDISVTGQLVSDSTVSKTLTQHVRIANDKFIP